MEEKAFEKRENQAMEEKQVAQAGSFCWNEACADYGQVGKGNMIKNGKTDKGVQRYRCQTCKQTFTETKGTLFYRCRHSEEEIVECLAMVGDRNSLAAIHRMKGIKEAQSRANGCPVDVRRTQGRKRGKPEEEG